MEMKKNTTALLCRPTVNQDFHHSMFYQYEAISN